MVVGMAALIFTTLALLRFTFQVKCDPVVVQINQTVSLFLLLSTLLFEEIASKSMGACMAVTFFTHYFLLVAGKQECWFSKPLFKHTMENIH